ncbi:MULTISPECIES: HEPN domain-containing protein [unclassified Dehalobacter]|uniref:HEPN domain-containing protein n=1 Tax=unclassified Dehalobacter TaxID=2635733 RepID=UPI000E6BF5E6|nr:MULTISPECIES: HEPN domain-containing protein [unclassified Dehalobacter]RJE46551.1 hypothetical protein A7K50_13300 [Dehalobacter sp. MCB1]TCX49937.1 hypothetical protein C1I36_08895 [Dehalobacter sp. 14DCB1]TCX54203.1 hypothetical protein C1I38_05430 [Dehalobacter sp. 12DCB1]
MDSKISGDLIKEFYRLTNIVVRDGINKALEYKLSKKYISTYYKFPKKNTDFPNGMPHFSSAIFTEGPADYKSIFTSSTDDINKIQYNTLSNYEELKMFLLNNTDIAFKIDLTIKDKEENVFQLKDYLFNSFLGSLIDRYLHMYNNEIFDEKEFEEMFVEKCIRYFEEKLSVDIAVPILMLNFEIDNYQINKNVSIVKMNDEFQLARIDVNSYGSGVHDTVLGCATHMVVFKNYEIKNESFESFYNTIHEESAYPNDLINHFFASLRLATGFDTGYAQLLCIPKNWADRYTAFLPPVYGTSVRAYPQYFDKYGWLKQTHCLTAEQLKLIANAFNKILSNDKNKLQIAINRFNRCYLRDNQEDSILDAIIALEILLSDDDKGELTYKITSRMAAIVSIGNYGEYTPLDIHKSMSKIYKYRSDIVHGRVPKKANELIALEKSSIPVIELAIDYLRIVIKTLLEHTEYFDIKQIDYYIVQSLGQK